MALSVTLFAKPSGKTIPEIVELDALCFPTDYRVSAKATWWWLAREGTKILGYAGMRYIEDADYGFFCRAGVVEEARGKGIHRLLIRRRIAYARRLGWAGVLTYTTPANHSSVNNLTALGFKLYEPEWKWAGKEMLYWLLNTSPASATSGQG